MESKILPQCQFPTTTRVCPKYSVHDCLWKQLRTSNSLHTPSNLRFEFFWYFTKSSFHHKRSETRLLVINMVYTSCRTTSHFGSYEIRKESQSSPEIKILLILAKNCWEIETKFPRIVCFTPKLECSLNILPMTVANPTPTDWSQLDSAWLALLSCNTGFEIRPFALIPMICLWTHNCFASFLVVSLDFTKAGKLYEIYLRIHRTKSWKKMLIFIRLDSVSVCIRKHLSI